MVRSYQSTSPTPADNPLAGISFELDGETFACKGRPSLLDLSELAEAAADDELGIVSPAGIASTNRFLRSALGVDEHRRFRRHCRIHNTPDQTVLDIIEGLSQDFRAAMEVAGGRPTTPSAPSSAGPPGPPGERTRRVISLQSGDVQIVALGPDEPPPPAGPNRQARRAAAAGQRKGKAKAAAAGG